jgi:hypothetical protein
MLMFLLAVFWAGVSVNRSGIFLERTVLMIGEPWWHKPKKLFSCMGVQGGGFFTGMFFLRTLLK